MSIYCHNLFWVQKLKLSSESICPIPVLNQCCTLIMNHFCSEDILLVDGFDVGGITEVVTCYRLESHGNKRATV